MKLQARRTRRILYIVIAVAALAGIALVVFALAGSRRAAQAPSAVVSASSASQPTSIAASGTGAGASTAATAPTVSATAPLPNASSTQGASGGTGKSPARKPSKPLPGKPPVVLATVPTGTVSFLGGVAGKTPQTYLVTGVVLGWQNRASGIAVVKIISARLLGPIDPTTGAEKSKPVAGTPNDSAALRGITVLAATSPRARTALRSDVHELDLVVLPGMGGSTFVIDRVVR